VIQTEPIGPLSCRYNEPRRTEKGERMSLPSFVILMVLAVQLCGCATNQAAIDDMERRHALMLERGGGSGGGGM
jgi:hypothetical protein